MSDDEATPKRTPFAAKRKDTEEAGGERKARKEKKEKKRKREKKASKRRSKKARASRDGDVSDRELSESSGGGGARESSARRDDDDPANPPPPVGVASVASDAFLAAARRVEAARSAALEEDALLERAGAPPANLLSFRSQGLDGVDPDASNLGGRAHLSAAARRAASERLDELVPKATGREAMLEKRAAVRQSNREMATAKEDAVFDGSFGGFGAAAAMGGGDDFAAALAASRAAKARRDARRGVDREALERRAEAHRAREEARVREFRALLKTDEG